MRLFIAEKPSMAMEIAKGLGRLEKKKGYYQIGDDIVTWAYGHILRLFNPNEYNEKYKNWCIEDLPIIPVDWKLAIADKCAEQFEIIRGLIGRADIIINAGDPDREGQLLVDEILDYVGNQKPVQRILLNALDEKSVRSALADLRDNKNFIGLKNSALARQRADWLIGMNLTRAFTIIREKAGYPGVLSIGRVRTPTLALVVRREEEIKEFVPLDYFQVKVNWQYGEEQSVIQSIWQPDGERITLDTENRLLDKSIAITLLQKIKTIAGYSNAVVSKKIEEEKKEAQCLPFSLSNLQVAAGKKYGYSPQDVLDTMQQLYEKKLTTYPRSDCTFLPENQLNDAKEVLKNLSSFSQTFEKYVLSSDVNVKSRAWNDKKISAHHAIIPTTVIANMDSLNEMQRNLYSMVAMAYIAQFYPIHIYQSTKLWIKCSDETFTATGKIIIMNGWKDLFHQEPENNGSDKDKLPLPNVKENDVVKYIEGTVLDKVTTPPKRFTTATLLQAMKEVHKYVKDPSLKTQLKVVSGIGTEATRAKIIDDLEKNGFLTVDKKNLIPSETAKMMINILPDEIKYPDLTAIWEDKLEQMVNNEISFNAFFEIQKSAVANFVDIAKKTTIVVSAKSYKCPVCGGVLLRKKWKNGYFYGCNNYPNCKIIFQEEKEKPLAYSCPCKKGFLQQRKGNKGLFWSCNRYPECKNAYSDRNGKPVIK